MTAVATRAAPNPTSTNNRAAKTILFVMQHDGLIRLYEPSVRLLEERGHRIHISYQVGRRQPGVIELRESLDRECAGVTLALAPEPASTPWASLIHTTRLLIDYLRYFDHHYDGADVLRQRVDQNNLLPMWLRRLMWPLRSVGDRGVSIAIALLRRLERVADTNAEVQKLLEEVRPDLVLVTPLVDFGSEQPEYLKAARALGIPTALCVASWDNLTIKGHMRVLPDRVFVWNEAQRQEAATFHGVEPSKVVVTGAQNFDHWFERQPSRSREAFCRTVGLDHKRPFVLFLASSVWMVPAEVRFVEEWIRRIRSADDPEVANVGILVRPHPGSFLRYGTLDLSLIENASVWPWGNVGDTYAEFSEPQREDLFDSLYHSVAAVGANTSALIEAGIMGRPVCTLRVPDFKNAQGAVHFAHLARQDGGLLHIADDFGGHLHQLSEFISGDGFDEERAHAFVRTFVRPHGIDAPAAPILADAIEAMAELEVKPKTQTPWHRALHALLTPLAMLSARLMAPKPKALKRIPVWQRLECWLRLRLAVLRARVLAWRLGLGNRARSAVRRVVHRSRKAD